VLPLLDVYRRYYGWRIAANIGVVFYVTMMLARLIMDVVSLRQAWCPSPTRISAPS
jgi:hypothetical protein